MQNIVLILTGGEIFTHTLHLVMKQYSFNTTIVVDHALEVADICNIKMDYLVGDFDSVSPELLEKYKKRISNQEVHTKIRTYNPVKDSTDTHIAIDLAISLGATQIIMLGATGTRFDHVLSNVNLLMLPLKKGISAIMYDSHNKIFLLDGDLNKNKNCYTIKKTEQYGDYISLLPLTEKVTGVTLTGFKYPLLDKTLTIGDSLGVSNELEKEECKIELKTGIMIVIESKD